MKNIGILGGMSWESSLVYYRQLNQAGQAKYGGLIAPNIQMYSFNFAEIAGLQAEENWDKLGDMLSTQARWLQDGGAELVFIATNTMHYLADKVQSAIDVPLVRITDAVGEEAQRLGCKKLALLGTRFTMEKPFYAEALAQGYQLEVVIPNAAERDVVHHVIYQELCQGKILPESRAKYEAMVARMVAEEGVDGIILGCTEIPLLIEDATLCGVPVLDTTTLHTNLILRQAFAENPVGV